MPPSLDGGFRACFLELLLDALGLVLLHAFLDGARRTLDEILGFLQTQTRDRADDLDDCHLVLAERLYHDVELGLLFDRGSRSSGTASGGDGNGRGGGNAPLLFERLHELDDLEYRLFAQGLDQFCIRQRHFHLLGLFLLPEYLFNYEEVRLTTAAARCGPSTFGPTSPRARRASSRAASSVRTARGRASCGRRSASAATPNGLCRKPDRARRRSTKRPS